MTVRGGGGGNRQGAALGGVRSSLSGSPRTAPMIMTAMAAPITGPAIYTHHPV